MYRGLHGDSRMFDRLLWIEPLFNDAWSNLAINLCSCVCPPRRECREYGAVSWQSRLHQQSEQTYIDIITRYYI